MYSLHNDKMVERFIKYSIVLLTMERKKQSSLKKLFKTEIYSTIVPVLAGAYSGYCNAQGIPFMNESAEELLHKVPIMVEAGLGAFLGPAYVKDVYNPNFFSEEKSSSNDLVICGSISGLGAILGGLKGILGVGLGYGMGQLV